MTKIYNKIIRKPDSLWAKATVCAVYIFILYFVQTYPKYRPDLIMFEDEDNNLFMTVEKLNDSKYRLYFNNQPDYKNGDYIEFYYTPDPEPCEIWICKPLTRNEYVIYDGQNYIQEKNDYHFNLRISNFQRILYPDENYNDITYGNEFWTDSTAFKEDCIVYKLGPFLKTVEIKSPDGSFKEAAIVREFIYQDQNEQGNNSVTNGKYSSSKDDGIFWSLCYERGDSMTFKSQYGNIQTLIVDKVSKKSLYNSLEKCYEYSIIKQPLLPNSSEKINGKFKISKEFHSSRLEIYSRLGEYCCSNVYKFKYMPVTDTIMSRFKNIDSNLDNYIIFDSNNSGYKKNSVTVANKITKYIINKRYGLIYYKYEDGEEFIRKFD